MSLRTHAIRLTPGTDVRRCLESLAREARWPAACVMTAAGSLDVARLRLAGATRIATYCGPLELVSLGGTLSPDGAHLHACIADRDGRTYGGHMAEGCTVHTTLEAVLAVMDTFRFSRRMDRATGYRELHIENDASTEG